MGVLFIPTMSPPLKVQEPLLGSVCSVVAKFSEGTILVPTSMCFFPFTLFWMRIIAPRRTDGSHAAASALCWNGEILGAFEYCVHTSGTAILKTVSESVQSRRGSRRIYGGSDSNVI